MRARARERGRRGVGLWPLMALVPCRSASWGGRRERRKAEAFLCPDPAPPVVGRGGGEGRCLVAQSAPVRPRFDAVAVPDVLSLPPAGLLLMSFLLASGYTENSER